jgi:deoxycytidylate deaminase
MSGNDDPSLIPWKENVTPAGHSINTKNTVPCCAPTTEPTIPSHHASEEDRIRRLLLEEAGYDCAKTLKRTTYLSWDDYFMAAAFLSAQRSKDPLSPQGACLVDHHQRVIGIGYNGFPRHCSDDLLPWTASSTTGDQCWLHSPHPYVCHAEVNAILNKCSDTVEGARLYVANFPCTSLLSSMCKNVLSWNAQTNSHIHTR